MRARKYFDGRLGQHSSNLIIALSLIVIISGTATTLLQVYSNKLLKIKIILLYKSKFRVILACLI